MSFFRRLLADVFDAGPRLAPGVGDAGGFAGEKGKAPAPPVEGAVSVVAAVGVLDTLDAFPIDSAPVAVDDGTRH